MQVLELGATHAVAGGEVGATHMGDDLHYTGYVTGSGPGDCLLTSEGSFLRWALCLVTQ